MEGQGAHERKVVRVDSLEITAAVERPSIVTFYSLLLVNFDNECRNVEPGGSHSSSLGILASAISANEICIWKN
jgi:hypothetical protein